MPRRLTLTALLLAAASVALAAPMPTGSSNAKPLDDAVYDGALDDATGALLRQRKFFTEADRVRAAKTRTLSLTAPAPAAAVKSHRDLFNDAARATLILSVRGENDTEAEPGIPGGERTLAAAAHPHAHRARTARRRTAAGAEASGFIIHESGVVATCLHALPNDKSNFVITACTVNGRIVTVRDILLADEETDIALLKIDPADVDGVLPLAVDVPAGEPIRVLGHPWYRYFHMTDGIVARHSRTDPDEENPEAARTPRIDITADIAEGSSGAPVLDARGVAVGMAHSYAVETDEEGVAVFKHRTAIPAAAILGKLRPAE